MHGRVKIRTTAEQESLKRKERAEKLARYKAGIAVVFQKRRDKIYDDQLMTIVEQILVQNPDIYTLWNIRREALVKNNLTEIVPNDSFKKELSLTESCLKENPKSYYVWHQRSWIMDQMPDPDWNKELALCAKCLNLDDRNFHCWNYREFVVERARIPATEEFEFSTLKIMSNFSNYSSWHYRSRLLSKMFLRWDKSLIDKKKNYELDLVMNATFTEPNDSSAWFYQRWLLDTRDSSLSLWRALLGKTVLMVSLNRSSSSDSLCLEANDERQAIDWESPNGAKFSKLWFAPWKHYSRLSHPEAEAREVKISVDGTTYPLRYCAEDEEWVYKSKKSRKNRSNQAQLLEQLSSYKQLVEMEPKNKWAILTRVLLMRKIDSLEFAEDIMQSLEALRREDSLRANYYDDLRSRFAIENALLKVWSSEEQLEIESEIDLSGLSLTTLSNVHQLGFFEQVNLATNSLSKSLHLLSCLRNCQKLSLSSNKLENLKNFPVLPELRVLSLRNNELQDPDEIWQVLRKLQELRRIDLRENPVCRVQGLAEKTRNEYPRLDLAKD